MKVFHLLFIFILGVSLISCYEREIACQDLLATNFSLSADASCDDCCVYPSVQLRLTHRIDEDVLFNRDSVLTNDAGQEYKISTTQIFLNDFDLEFQDGTVNNVRESRLFEDEDGEQTELVDDHVMFQSSNSLAKAGSIRENGPVKSLGFNVGVNHELIAIEDESSIFNVDSLYTSNGYYDINLYLLIGPSLETNKTIRMFVKKDNANILLEPTDVTKSERTDFSLQVAINYELLLKEVVIDETSEVQFVEDYIIPVNLLKLEE